MALNRIFDVIDALVSAFDITEKDMVMLLFIGMVVFFLILWGMIDYAIKWCKRNQDILQLDMEYTKKILLVPVLALILRANSVGKEERRERIKEFIYG